MNSTLGYVFSRGTKVICWIAKKQQVVAQSTTEDEYIALSAVSNQAIWLQKFRDLGFVQDYPLELY